MGGIVCNKHPNGIKQVAKLCASTDRSLILGGRGVIHECGYVFKKHERICIRILIGVTFEG